MINRIGPLKSTGLFNMLLHNTRAVVSITLGFMTSESGTSKIVKQREEENFGNFLQQETSKVRSKTPLSFTLWGYTS